jgi:TRAP-type C4-dicarboxylate transport system permease small subunit
VSLGGALALVGVMFSCIALYGGDISILGLVAIAAGIALLAMYMKRVRTVSEAPVVHANPADALTAKPTYPDDDKLAAVVRSSDEMLGKFEQVVLVTLLFSVMMVAVIATLSDKIADAHPFGHFKDDAIRGGTFAMALIGAAFAMHQGRHLSMDLISRRLAPRARLFLKIVLALFTIFIVLLMIRSGFHTIVKEAEFKADDKLITPMRLAYLVPIGGALIIVHTLLHTIIDLNYIFRGKTPPEKMRTGH